MASSLISPAIRLNNGLSIPQLGFGLYQTEVGQPSYQACVEAIRVGYRHFDTARLYGNEAEVGKAIRDSGLPREDFFVTTKVWNTDQGYEAALNSGLNSNKRIGLGYIDLLLLHAPVVGKRLDSYRALEKLLEMGVVRSIGVSNYGIHHLEELLEVCKVKPVVNQIEVHPFNTRNTLADYCTSKGIVVESLWPKHES